MKRKKWFKWRDGVGRKQKEWWEGLNGGRREELREREIENVADGKKGRERE